MICNDAIRECFRVTENSQVPRNALNTAFTAASGHCHLSLRERTTEFHIANYAMLRRC